MNFYILRWFTLSYQKRKTGGNRMRKNDAEYSGKITQKIANHDWARCENKL
jgi:hypothetical protein